MSSAWLQADPGQPIPVKDKPVTGGGLQPQLGKMLMLTQLSKFTAPL